nr:uncharacterized protein LOC129275898 [Lytechinus pictus]
MDDHKKKVTLEFNDLCLTINKRDVLRRVSGFAEPGQLLAIMGPSGAGKTRLLTCLAGRQSARRLESGNVFLNGQPICKRLKRQISFVLQEDLFLSELTLKDTLKVWAIRRTRRMKQAKYIGSINHASSFGSLQDDSLDNSVFIDCVINEDDCRVGTPRENHVIINSLNTNVNSSTNNRYMTSLSTELQTKPPINKSHKDNHGDKFSRDNYTLNMESQANADKWPTGYFRQLLTLTHRNFKQNRYLVISGLDFFKHLMIGFIAGALWFQIKFTEDKIRDISGALFFISAYWGFESIYSSLTSFQIERAVLAKERSAGAYRLSAYFMSKVIGVLPLLSTMTVISVTITFWMVGLHDSVLVYLLFVTTFLLYVQAGQALGRFVSAACSSISQAITASSLVMLTSMLLGGFYVVRLPRFLSWLRYISYTSYMYGALLEAVFVLDPPTISCNTTAISDFGDCLSLSKADDNIANMSALSDAIVSNSSSIASTQGTLDGTQIVDKLLNLGLPIWGYYLVLLAYFVTFNCLAYLMLRFRRIST